MKNFKKGEEVLITSYNPPIKGNVADYYELPFEQVPMTDKNIVKKYQGKKVPIVEVFINGKLLSFIDEVVNKIN
jgi:hypothetical protein